ncbi:MAG: DNA polymerase III subunit beta [Elusimicrobiota bacterium]|jgi:DNA polymerase-3 subunit beta|nr:DNA polymerase III subunit beta [Elusimicrobiota bacterium]
MNFYCAPKDLSQALFIVSKAITNKNIPILEGIKISAFGKIITLTAFDTELLIEKKISATIKEEGEVVVSGKLFNEFISRLEEDEIEILKEGEKINVFYGRNKCIIQCLNEKEFPLAPAINGAEVYEIKEASLKELFEKTLFCISTDDTRPILKGELLEVKEDNLNVVSLDGYRLAIGSCGIRKERDINPVVISGKVLKEVASILKSAETNVKIITEKSFCHFIIRETRITIRLLEGEYLKYERIIPETIESTVSLKKEKFVKILDRAMLFFERRNDSFNYVTLEITDEKIKIRANTEIAKINEICDCKKEGEDKTITFNCNYLYDILRTIKEEEIVILISGNATPTIVKPKDSPENFKYLVLPVKNPNYDDDEEDVDDDNDDDDDDNE